jgi:hypothetical protein
MPVRAPFRAKLMLELLMRSMIPNMECFLPQIFKFKQDNARISPSDEVVLVCDANVIDLSVSSTNSSDLKPMDNISGLLYRLVCANSMIFSDL